MIDMLSKTDLIEFGKYLRLDINHANYGYIVSHSHNILPYNRIFMVAEIDGPDGGYIKSSADSSTGAKWFLRTGHCYFIPRGYPLEFNFRKGLYIIGIHFSLEFFAGYDVFSENNTILECGDAAVEICEIRNLFEEPSDLGRLSRLQGRILTMAGRFTDLTLKRLDRVVLLQEKYRRLLSHVETVGDATTTVKTLAGLMGVPRDTLSKNFSRDMGVPLKTYLTRALVKKASEKLLTSHLKVREVAEALNFNNEYYFCRFFKKHTGQTPGNYRSLIRQI